MERHDASPQGPADLSPLARSSPAQARYEFLKRLHAGPSSEVWECAARATRQRVAIKILRTELARDGLVQRRFLREAKAASALDHPGAVKILSYEQPPDQSPYLVMELLRGASLAERLRGGLAMPIGTALDIAQQLADTLAGAHNLKIVHRDVQPESILLIKDPLAPLQLRAKLLGFGVACLLQETRLTAFAAQGGAPPAAAIVHLSPEQIFQPELAAEPSDVYSLGVVLYQMITGRIPFTAEAALARARSGNGAPPPLSLGTPWRVRSLLGAMLQPVASLRPTMRDVALVLRRLVQPPGRRWRFAALGLLALGIGAGAASLTWQRRTVCWPLDSTPSRALVTSEEGTRLGETPLRLCRKRNQGPWRVVLRRPAYVDLRVDLDLYAADHGQEGSFTLLPMSGVLPEAQARRTREPGR